jgi:hypothetical protein
LRKSAGFVVSRIGALQVARSRSRDYTSWSAIGFSLPLVLLVAAALLCLQFLTVLQRLVPQTAEVVGEKYRMLSPHTLADAVARPDGKRRSRAMPQRG